MAGDRFEPEGQCLFSSEGLDIVMVIAAIIILFPLGYFIGVVVTKKILGVR